MTTIFFIMIGVQCVAYLWFQGKGGVVSHRNFTPVFDYEKGKKSSLNPALLAGMVDGGLDRARHPV